MSRKNHILTHQMPGPFSQVPTDLPLSNSRHSYNVRKSQLDFPDPVDNSMERAAFKPNLPVKHHAMVPLGYQNVLDYTLDPDPARAKYQLKFQKQTLAHPYLYEMRHIPYPTSMFTVSQPILPPPIETMPAELVDTPEALAEMTEELKQAKEIAVDLEHHDTHSYYGFTCLMQISTREKDWLVDTLKLRGALREDKLGGVLADPSIVKVGFDVLRISLRLALTDRSSTVPSRILSGCRRISTCTSSTCSTRTTPRKSWVSNCTNVSTRKLILQA